MTARSSESGVPRTERRCVLVARHQDSRRLRELLRSRGVAVVDSTDFDAGLPADSVLRQAIKVADFVLAVLDVRSVWGGYEVGFAMALRKPVMLVVPTDKRAVPSSLLAQPHVIAAADDLDAIGFYLDQFLESGLKTPRRIRQQDKQMPPHAAADIAGLRTELSEAREPVTERALHEILKQTLNIAGLKYVAESSALLEIDGRPDFAVWSDSLELTTGNPLIIEVKTDVADSVMLQRAIAQVRNYVRQAGSQWGLLLYRTGPPGGVCFPSVFGLSLDSFLAAVESGSLPEALALLRDRSSRGGG